MPSGPTPLRKTASLFLSTLILFSFCLFALWHDREYRLAAEIEKEQGKNRTVNPNNFSWDKVEGLIKVNPPSHTDSYILSTVYTKRKACLARLLREAPVRSPDCAFLHFYFNS